MTPDSTATDKSNEGLVYAELVSDGLLAFAFRSETLDLAHAIWSKFSAVAKLLSLVLAVVLIGSAKPVRRIVANAIVASMEYVKRVGIKSVYYKPTYTKSGQVDCIHGHLAAHLVWRAS